MTTLGQIKFRGNYKQKKISFPKDRGKMTSQLGHVCVVLQKQKIKNFLRENLLPPPPIGNSFLLNRGKVTSFSGFSKSRSTKNRILNAPKKCFHFTCILQTVPWQIKIRGDYCKQNK